MTNDNKTPMFGPTQLIDVANWEPRAGKCAFVNEIIAELSAKPPGLAETILSNCTTSLPFKFEYDPEGMAVRPSLLPLSAPSQFAADVLMALGCQRDALESDGVSLTALSRVLGMKYTTEGDRRILEALLELKRLVPALSELRYSEADGLVRAGDVHK